MKKRGATIFLIAVFLVGLALMLYPAVSDYYNSLHQSRAVADYFAQVEQLDEPQCNTILQQAQEYNQSLAQRLYNNFVLNEEETAVYENMLALTEVMSYIEIPSIRCKLPIYHGTSEEVLEVGVGHVEGSALPVGGESTHCVLSGHRGLPSAKLFTDLDKMVEGDVFFLKTMNETLTYKVDQVRIVEPSDISELGIVPGQDYCTLVTCTPYGINSHRLLVRGHRIENAKEAVEIKVPADAIQIDPMLVAPFTGVPIFIAMLVWVLCGPSGKKGSRREKGAKKR